MRRLLVALTLTMFAGIAGAQKAEIDKWWPIIKAAGIGAQAQ